MTTIFGQGIYCCLCFRVLESYADCTFDYVDEPGYGWALVDVCSRCRIAETRALILAACGCFCGTCQSSGYCPACVHGCRLSYEQFADCPNGNMHLGPHFHIPNEDGRPVCTP